MQISKNAQETLILRKSYSAKATTIAKTEAGEEGTFEALVSVFGNVDSQGDTVEKGAYGKSLKAWNDKGRPIPVLWSHDFSDPDSILGKYVSAEETDEGLLMKGQLDLSHPKAARVHKLMQEGLVVEFSMSGLVTDYEMIKAEKEDDDDEDVFTGLKIKEVDLWEAGPCFKGANSQTELRSVKSLEGGAGEAQVLVEKREVQALDLDSLKEAHKALAHIIGLVEKTAETEKNVSQGNTGGDDSISAGTSTEKSALSPAVRVLLDIPADEKQLGVTE